ncbi:hypothetical protein FFLO_01225 [Filobasidium floriforme]|uniref:Uncharacterized protein n=1 Tax=Filobasidium floriforme TaxID=5210 RepID=A0A8K0NV10_9TREE|nr:hypothetical protein FFLO_01225 [Filobasidium floriforme]
MRSAHLLATGVLLTSHGLSGAEALGWRDKVPHAAASTEEAGFLRYRERDDTSITELADLGIVRRSDLMEETEDTGNYDCHKQIRQRIHLACSADAGRKSGVSGWDEAERAGVAIALTLCSIQSALQSPPVECEPWSPYSSNPGPSEVHYTRSSRRGETVASYNELDDRYGRQGFPVDDGEGRAMRGRCLEALHRSPQDWSSYNGYLADATKQCHALKGQQTLDIAKEIYRNSTMEKLALLQMLKTHELARRDTESSVEARLSDRIETLRDMVSNIDNAGVRLDDQLSRQETNMNAGLERLDESVKQALALKDDFWFDVHSRWEAVLSDLQGRLSAVIRETGERSLDELNIELHHALGAHGTSLKEQERAHGLALANHATKLEERSLRAYDIDVARMDLAEERWDALSMVIRSTSQTLEIIADRLNDLEPVLKETISTAVTIKEESVDQLQHNRLVAQEIRLTLQGQDEAVKDGRRAWEDLKAGFTDERMELEQRKEGRMQWGFKGTFTNLVQVVAPAFSTIPAIQIVSTVFNRYPCICNLLGVFWACLSTIFDGLYWVFWMTTWSYILLKTGLWRLMRLVYKLGWDIYSELQGPIEGEEQGRGIEITTPPRGGVKWALPMSPDITPKRPAGKINRDHDETDESQEVTQTTHGYVGALGLIMEDDEDNDPFLVRSQPRQTRTRVGSRPTAGDGSRKRSLGAQVDRMKRRAQSEPLY